MMPPAATLSSDSGRVTDTDTSAQVPVHLNRDSGNMEDSTAPKRGIVAALWVLVRAACFLAIFAIVFWAAVRYGQISPPEASARCQQGSHDIRGFQGDPDFYGLGIRVGIYLQWLTDLITTGFLEKDRHYVLMTYHIFSISITIALFVKIFSPGCTFSAEIYVIYILIWPGYNIVQIPMFAAISLTNFVDEYHGSDEADGLTLQRPPRRLRWSMQLLNFAMSPLMIWFWIRRVIDEDADFAPTSSSTIFFFFAPISDGALRPLSIS